MHIVIRIVSLIVGYLFGLFNTGKIIAAKTGHDLNQEGSKNPGATNALRVLGVKAGLFTFLGDSLKAIIPISIARILCSIYAPELLLPIMLYIGLGTILGHVYPATRSFRGGKGVSTTAGVVIGISPILFVIPIVVFILLSIITGYVSLGSVTAYILVIVEAFLYGFKVIKQPDSFVYLEYVIILTIIPLIGIIKHHENIVRLINGTENRFGHKKENSND